MTEIITKKTSSPAVRSRSETKADITDNTARAIIEAEADQRELKTLRLRQARAEMEANQPKPEPAKARTTKARTTKTPATRAHRAA